MTIEEKFFKTFDIEPKRIEKATGKGFYIEHYTEETYPEITSDIFLELICILVQWDRDYEFLTTAKYVDDLKQGILNDCIQSAKQFNEYFSEQVRSLFEVEERNNNGY